MASRGQSVTVAYIAWDTSANDGKTGDVLNHTLRVVKDGTSAAPTNSPAEVDSVNAPGVYKITLTATECTADCVVVCGKSSTPSVSIMPITVMFEQLPTAAPTAAGGVRDAAFINGVSTSSVTAVNANVGTTQPVNFTGTAGSALVKGDAVDIAGAAVNAGAAQLGVNVVNYAGTAAAVGADNLPKVGVWGFLGTLFTESVGGNIAAAFKKAFDVASSVWTTASINQTGDSYSRIGANGGALTALAPASTALSNATWTSARAAYLDNLNIGGAAASHADIIAINLSATKHVLLKTVGQYEPGEQYTIELNTFDATTGEPVNADSTPSLTATGKVSGSLSANLSAVTNSATGVYLWTYTPGASPPLEEIRFSASPSVNGVVRTISTYAQTVDFATAVFTSTDQSHLTSIFNKLPANNIADETTLAAAIALCQQAGAAVTLPTNPPANWLNAAAIAAGALDGKGDWATAGAQMDLVNAPNATALAAIANAYLNLANGIEMGITPLQAERAMLAVLCGKLTVSGSNPEVFQNPAGTANRVSVANDTAGNRTVVTITA